MPVETPALPQTNILLLCYSVSQARILKALIERAQQPANFTSRILQSFKKAVPKPFSFTVVSFNDNAVVNQQIAKEFADHEVTFFSFDDFVKQNSSHAKNPKNLDNPFKFDHPYTDLLTQQVNAAYQLVEQLNPHLVMVVEDGPGGCDPIIKAANHNKIPVVIMPFGIGEFRDYEIFLQQKHEEGALNKVPYDDIGTKLKAHASNWIVNTEYGEVTLFPAEFVLARLASGLDLPNPWLVQGGTADKLLVESVAMQRIYSREGVPSDKLEMVGSVYADVVYDALKKSKGLIGKKWIGGRHAKILLSIPPNYHNEKSRITEFQSYSQTLEEMIEAIQHCVPQSKLTVSLHPAESADTIHLIKDMGVNLSERWILEEIGYNDIFISTFSSTTRWALAAKKYVLNYDMYNFDLPTYDTVPYFFSCSRLAELEEQLEKLVKRDREVLKQYKKMFAQADEWGMMDGRNFKRIWKFLNDMIDGEA